MRKNSPEYFRVNSKKKWDSDKLSDSQFTPNFEQNFKDEFISDDNHEKESHFRISNSKNESDSDKIDSIISNIENFVNSREFKEPIEDEINMINLKMTSYLSDINTITRKKYGNKPHIKKALGLQVLILTNMVKLAQIKMNDL
jgi:hypothetical protein